jgi:hypothetical protein
VTIGVFAPGPAAHPIASRTSFSRVPSSKILRHCCAWLRSPVVVPKLSKNCLKSATKTPRTSQPWFARQLVRAKGVPTRPGLPGPSPTSVPHLRGCPETAPLTTGADLRGLDPTPRLLLGRVRRGIHLVLLDLQPGRLGLLTRQGVRCAAWTRAASAAWNASRLAQNRAASSCRPRASACQAARAARRAHRFSSVLRSSAARLGLRSEGSAPTRAALGGAGAGRSGAAAGLAGPTLAAGACAQAVDVVNTIPTASDLQVITVFPSESCPETPMPVMAATSGSTSSIRPDSSRTTGAVNDFDLSFIPADRELNEPAPGPAAEGEKFRRPVRGRGARRHMQGKQRDHPLNWQPVRDRITPDPAE